MKADTVSPLGLERKIRFVSESWTLLDEIVDLEAMHKSAELLTSEHKKKGAEDDTLVSRSK